jgi:hypothetical protein
MTEREAQEAAISSFGPVRAVVRAHHARRGSLAAAAEAGLAAWKLTAILLLTSGAIALALTTLSAGGVGVPVPGGFTLSPGLAAAAYPAASVDLAAAAYLTLAVGYTIRMARTLRRERRDQAGTFGHVLGEG